MQKNKRIILMGIIIFAVVILCGTKSFAAENEITYTREFPSNDGTIVVNLKGLNLDSKKTYQFALSTRKSGEPNDEAWYDIVENDTTTAKINLSGSNETINEVLAKTDNGRLWIKETGAENSSAIKVDVDLKLPPEVISAVSSGLTNGQFGNYLTMNITSLYGKKLEGTGYQFYKITDREIIDKWLKYKLNENTNVQELYDLINKKITIPTVNYQSSNYIGRSELRDRKDGLYIVWATLTGDNYKTTYGYSIYDGLYDEGKTLAAYLDNVDEKAPEVTSISVTSPKSGTYKTGEKITLDVTFTEEITGDTVPTLKIKFGTSEERSLSNGTISGKKIAYTYTLVNGDVGQLAVTSLSGGTIKDASGNLAKIASKTVSGNTIKANVVEESKPSTNNGASGETNNGSNAGTQNGTLTDTPDKVTGKPSSNGTEYQGEFGQYGGSMAIVFVIVAASIVFIVGYKKYNKVKFIK